MDCDNDDRLFSTSANVRLSSKATRSVPRGIRRRRHPVRLTIGTGKRAFYEQVAGVKVCAQCESGCGESSCLCGSFWLQSNYISWGVQQRYCEILSHDSLAVLAQDATEQVGSTTPGSWQLQSLLIRAQHTSCPARPVSVRRAGHQDVQYARAVELGGDVVESVIGQGAPDRVSVLLEEPPQTGEGLKSFGCLVAWVVRDAHLVWPQVDDRAKRLAALNPCGPNRLNITLGLFSASWS